MRRPDRRFLLRLARKTGFVNLDEMLASTTAEQITEWIEDYKIDLWPEDRIELQLAKIGSAIVNAIRLSRPFVDHNRTELTTPKDFIIDLGKTAPKPNGLKQHNAIVSRFIAAGAAIKPRVSNG